MVTTNWDDRGKDVEDLEKEDELSEKDFDDDLELD